MTLSEFVKAKTRIQSASIKIIIRFTKG